MPTCWLNRSERSRTAECPAFTIVESLVALTIMGVGTLAVIGAIRLAADATDRLREECLARQVAEAHMVRLLQRPGRPPRGAHGVAGRFMWEEKVRPGRVPGTAELIVTVRWYHEGRMRTFELVSIKWTMQQDGP